METDQSKQERAVPTKSRRGGGVSRRLPRPPQAQVVEKRAHTAEEITGFGLCTPIRHCTPVRSVFFNSH